MHHNGVLLLEEHRISRMQNILTFPARKSTTQLTFFSIPITKFLRNRFLLNWFIRFQASITSPVLHQNPDRQTHPPTPHPPSRH
jgi:hypothetical protein